jgi:molecular chaperone Hsp31 and glyoxalase 3
MHPSSDDKRPTADSAEYNAFFPSPYSLSQFTSPKSDLSGADYPQPYKGGRWKILMIAADERYLPMQNGTRFSTGNHPIETLLPMYHLDKAGFAFDVATLSGNPVKFEYWAFPGEDAEVKAIHDKYLAQFQQPLKLADVLAQGLGDDSDYLALFIPGGHGALIGLPQSTDVKAALHWAVQHDRHIITLCHGPAALLAAGVGEAPQDYLFKDYKICAFPDTLDAQTPQLGYMPGQMQWFMGGKLKALGVEIINQDIAGHTHQDRKLITGDSPYASNKVGQLAAQALLSDVEKR